MDRYNISFPAKTREQDSVRLINQLWKLIPMRENGEDWITHWANTLEEIAGLAEIYKDKVESLVLLSKLEGLSSQACEDFMLYRRTVFKCIDLVSKVLKDD